MHDQSYMSDVLRDCNHRNVSTRLPVVCMIKMISGLETRLFHG